MQCVASPLGRRRAARRHQHQELLSARQYFVLSKPRAVRGAQRGRSEAAAEVAERRQRQRHRITHEECVIWADDARVSVRVCFFSGATLLGSV